MADRNKTGTVFDIQPFSIHNGPGIRTTVFVKGCPLRCLWCGNPESQLTKPILLARETKCVACGACAAVCPQKAITIVDGKRIIDWSKCDQCLKCVEHCIYGSLHITGETKTVGECIDAVMKDEIFYQTSGGGMTISGGEPLMQSEFVTELFKAAKEKGLHTALDTTGYADWSIMEKVLQYVDLILYDVKNMDPVKHKEGTGVSNELILENFRKASKLAEVWVRIPLIEGYNDSVENITKVAELAEECGVKKVSLLPYHEGGVSKCEQIGVEYKLKNAKAPSNEHMQELADICKAKGIKVVLGS